MVRDHRAPASGAMTEHSNSESHTAAPSPAVSAPAATAPAAAPAESAPASFNQVPQPAEINTTALSLTERTCRHGFG